MSANEYPKANQLNVNPVGPTGGEVRGIPYCTYEGSPWGLASASQLADVLPSNVGPTGPTGPESTVPGPTGPTGPTGVGVTGPTGADSTVPGPTGATGAASTVPGPTGPTGADSTVPGPTGPTGPTGSAAGIGTEYTISFSVSLYPDDAAVNIYDGPDYCGLVQFHGPPVDGQVDTGLTFYRQQDEIPSVTITWTGVSLNGMPIEQAGSIWSGTLSAQVNVNAMQGGNANWPQGSNDPRSIALIIPKATVETYLHLTTHPLVNTDDAIYSTQAFPQISGQSSQKAPIPGLPCGVGTIYAIADDSEATKGTGGSFIAQAVSCLNQKYVQVDNSANNGNSGVTEGTYTIEKNALILNSYQAINADVPGKGLAQKIGVQLGWGLQYPDSTINFYLPTQLWKGLGI